MHLADFIEYNLGTNFNKRPPRGMNNPHWEELPSRIEVWQWLLDPARLVIGRRTREGHTIVVPAFHVCGVEIWGATAMVLAEFLAILGWSGE